MKTTVQVWDQVAALAHESVTRAEERATHGVFAARQLVLCALALAAAPFAVALGGAPSLSACFAFALALLPILVFLAVTRTGDLRRAAAMSAAAFLAFALALAFAAPSLAGVATAFAALAPLEALFAGGLALAGIAGAAAVVVILACAALAQDSGAAPFLGFPFVLVAGVACLHALTTACGVARIMALRSADGAHVNAERSGLAALFDDFVVRLDRTGAVLGAVNPGAGVLGLAGADLMGRGLFERVHVADRPLFLKTVSDAFAAGAVFEADMRVRAATTGDGVCFGLVRLRVSPVQNGVNERTLLAALADVGERRAQEEKLADACTAAAESSASRDRFLANISHELRTPLNAIIGFSEILGSDMMPLDPARRREYAGIINSSGQHLLQVVNSILDMSKIESGSFQLAAEHFELTPLVDQCCDMMRLKAEEAQVILTRETPASLPEIVGDKRAVKQILINLVSNAVKFAGPGGAVAVRARLAGAGVAIEVEDNGIGVGARDLGRLGDPFFQAQDAYDRPYEGTGLGLSVVRGLVGLHGGAIRIESAPGEGTRVTITLPLDYRAAPAFSKGRVARIETITRGPCRPAAPDEKVKQIA